MRLPAILWLAGLLPHAIDASQEKDNLLRWFHQKGGMLNSKQEIRLEEPEKGENSRFAIFATEVIAEGEVLASIPWDIVAAPADYGIPEYNERQEEYDFDCDAALVWKKERDNFKFVPYHEYLQSQPERYTLPGLYSAPGRALFFRLIGGQDYTHVFLDSAIGIKRDFAIACGLDSTDEAALDAAMEVTKYSFDGLMIPLHDLYTHRNGHYHNTKVTMVNGKHVQIEARRDIAVGEQLHSRYDEPENTLLNPAEIFRDHGIVAKHPHHWILPGDTMYVPARTKSPDGHDMQVVVHTDYVHFQVTKDEETGEIDVIIDDTKNVHPYFLHTFFYDRVKDLNHFKNVELNATAEENGVPEHEFNTLMEFLDIYLGALNRAFHQVHQKIKSSSEFFGEDDERSEGVCVVEDNWDHHYSLFWVWFDDTPYNHANCLSSEWTDFASYDVFEKEKSNYQELEWKYREEDDDTCLHLDRMLQICSSYRPHYHEFFVHYAARYVPSVKRVIFLGSGDAMLLHEILKYPDLEKVVGLELDQFVTRKSFKHFKTQPHYDDPRVEWWYGDATKTLPLLPQDYWGSFDLLLVDLSETVVSLHVTGDHDVLDVISNLLKPEGVMFENELYLHAMSRHFDHTAQIFYGSPKVCTQVQSLSSNRADFMRSPIYDHGVDTFLIDDVEDPWDRFRFIHDYLSTDAKCDGTDGVDEEETGHGRKAGVLMVLEAEKTSVTLDEKLGEALHNTLKSVGLTPLEKSAQASTGTIQVVMKEGYIVARPWPELNYVGFDINLWGAFDKMEEIREALSETVGSQTKSSFRVVVGGMHGSSTWEQDQNKIGVQFSQSRDCSVTDMSEMYLFEAEALYVGIQELLPDTQGLNILVICGPQTNAIDCVGVDGMKKYEAVETVAPLYSCEGLPEYNGGTEDFSSMIECEKKLVAELQQHYESEGRFDMVVIDFGAPASMLQILLSVLSYHKLRRDLLEPEYLVVSPYHRADQYRFRFMHELRTTIRDEFLALGEFYFQGRDNQFLGLSVLIHGDETAVYTFSALEHTISDRLPHTDVELHGITSGMSHPKIDKKLEERSFRPEDYDMEPNRKQFQEQRPLGRQTIFQLELTDEEATMPSLSGLSTALQAALEAMQEGQVVEIESFTDVGDGALMLTKFDSGDVVLTWDGADHVDINLFVLDQDKNVVDNFLDKFLGQTEGQLSRTLRDDQPRGIGRVVNFQSDIDADPLEPYRTK